MGSSGFPSLAEEVLSKQKEWLALKVFGHFLPCLSLAPIQRCKRTTKKALWNSSLSFFRRFIYPQIAVFILTKNATT